MTSPSTSGQQPQGSSAPPIPTTPAPMMYAISPVNTESPEYKMRQHQDMTGWSHNRPNSVLIAAMGNHWKPGSWQHVMDMMKFTIDRGVWVEFREFQDRCFEYADALGTMRNEGAIAAQNLGVEWICYIDNDIWPPQEALLRLLEWHDNTKANVMAPYIVEHGTGRPLHGPPQAPDTGFKWMKWTVLSLLMFKMCVFRHYPSDFWRDAIGADEGYHFQKLYRDGFYLGMDTGLQVPTLRRPQYPLATNHYTDDDRKNHWEWVNKSRLQPPDRRPIDPNDPRVDQHGSYNPFVPPQEEPKQPAKAPEELWSTGDLISLSELADLVRAGQQYHAEQKAKEAPPQDESTQGQATDGSDSNSAHN